MHDFDASALPALVRAAQDLIDWYDGEATPDVTRRMAALRTALEAASRPARVEAP